MSRISARFDALRSRGRKALIAYVMAGDPTEADTLAYVAALEEAGVDIVELGVPFTDPLADGPTIQRANERALAGGADLHSILEMVKKLRLTSELPVLLMTYYNPILRIGLQKAAGLIAGSGVDGVLITDLPPEEAAEWRAAAQDAGLDTIFLLAPTSTPERIRLGAAQAAGFVYAVSRLGVTGEQAEVAPGLDQLLQRIRHGTDQPIAAGFGISSGEQAAEAARYADGVVVGSAFVRRIESAGPDAAEEVKRFAQSLRAALDGAA